MKLDILSLQAKKLFDELVQDEEVREYLAALSDFHKETYEHVLRVGLLSLDLGFENELSQQDLRSLGYAALLHDIGKTKIPRDILSTPTDLAPHEFETIQEHVRLGFLELADLEDGMVQEIVVAHHEFTKTPYPRNGIDRRQKARVSRERRKKNLRILKLAQIVAVADMADALAHNRSYKGAFSKDRIEEILSQDFTGDHKFISQILRRLSGDNLGDYL